VPAGGIASSLACLSEPSAQPLVALAVQANLLAQRLVECLMCGLVLA
jgi:hypothetical protein